MQRTILLFGPQGSGKGTQGERLSASLQLPLIGTGALLRAEATKQTERGRSVAEELKTGNLITEAVTNAILFDRLQEPDAAHGFILDGYPRNRTQEEAFAEFLKGLRGGTKITHALVLEIPDDEAVARLAERRVCSTCGEVYHSVNRPTRAAGICDVCGGAVVQRSDDTSEAIRRRLEIYHADTEPLLKAYEAQGIVRRIDARGTIEEVAERITKSIA